MPERVEPTLAYAQLQDREDELQSFRSRFFIPRHEEGEVIYFCGNSLGLQPRETEDYVRQELIDWREIAGHYVDEVAGQAAVDPVGEKTT